MAQKLIVVVVGAADAESVFNSLTGHQYTVTRMSSTGGFLRQKNTTLIIGLDEADVPGALDAIRFACHSDPVPEQYRATAFVLNANSFEQV